MDLKRRWGQGLGTHRLTTWSTVALLAAGLAGCGATTHGKNGDVPGPDGSGASAGEASVGGRGGSGGAAGGSAGVSTTALGVTFDGHPQYFRFVRLTNAQWAASVQEVLHLAEPSALAVWQTLPQPLFMTTGAAAPAASFMIPTEPRPPASGESKVS